MDRCNTPSKRVVASADTLPLLSDSKYFSDLLGWSPTYTARLCRNGVIPAAKVGKCWRINTREALRAMGLLHDQGEEA